MQLAWGRPLPVPPDVSMTKQPRTIPRCDVRGYSIKRLPVHIRKDKDTKTDPREMLTGQDDHRIDWKLEGFDFRSAEPSQIRHSRFGFGDRDEYQ